MNNNTNHGFHVSHETERTKTPPNLNDIPVLTDIYNDETIIKPNFFAESIFAKNYKPLNLIEQTFHHDLTFSFQQRLHDNQWLSFLSLLNQSKSQQLFFSDYYHYWIIRILSTHNIAAYKVLSFDFLWKKILNLAEEDIFHLILPTVEVLYFSKSYEELFHLLNNINEANIYLSQDWFFQLVNFDETIKSSNGTIDFNSLLIKNQKLQSL